MTQPKWWLDRSEVAKKVNRSATPAHFISAAVLEEVTEVLANISPMERSMRDFIGELNFRYYQGMTRLGIKGPPVANVDIDLFSRRIVKGRHELMYWEFKLSGHMPSPGQSACLNDLALSVDNDILLGMAEPDWSGVYFAHCNVESDFPRLESPVLISKVCPNPTTAYMPSLVVSSPVEATLADLLGIIKHCERPSALLRKVSDAAEMHMIEEFKGAWTIGGAQ